MFQSLVVFITWVGWLTGFFNSVVRSGQVTEVSSPAMDNVLTRVAVVTEVQLLNAYVRTLSFNQGVKQPVIVFIGFLDLCKQPISAGSS